MSWEDPVYGTCQVTEPAGDGTYRCTSLIVIRKCGAIARFTQLHVYDLRASPRTSKEPSASGGTRLRLITGILNLALGLRCPRPEPGLAHILSLTKEELEDCFEAKARGTEDGKGVSSGTMERTVRAVAGFLLQVRKDHPEEMALREEDLFEAAEVRDRYGRRTMALRPAFTVPDAGKAPLPFRDLPGKAALFLIQTAFRRAPDIAFAVCLQYFAGLREGEAMNVRPVSSPFGPGILVSETGGAVTDIAIDLRDPLLLRPDIPTGHNKRFRMVHLHPAFRAAFLDAFGRHMDILRARSYDPASCPLFPGRNGKAMTVDSYRKRFDVLVRNHFLPALLGSSDPELAAYGLVLSEHKLTPHALRHAFSASLVLMGEDIAGLQSYRGDSSPQSAFTYLQNKGDLSRRCAHVQGKLLDALFREAGLGED